MDKTHYRKAFNSPYLSSADIVGVVTLTIKCVKLELDKTKKTRDMFNTAYFVEREIRKGEPLKPMILNVSNSKVVKDVTGSPFIDDWNNVKVAIYVDHNVRFGRDTVEGLRISPHQLAVNDDQISDLRTLILATASDEAKLCEFFKVDSLESLSQPQYEQASRMLSAKKAQNDHPQH